MYKADNIKTPREINICLQESFMPPNNKNLKIMSVRMNVTTRLNSV